MTGSPQSAPETQVVRPDRVRETVKAIIAGARASGWTLESIAQTSGVKLDTIRGWLNEGKEPSLSKAFSVACVIGERAVNSLLAIIGYGGAVPLDEPNRLDLARIVADGIADFSIIASAAADGRIDHTEEPRTTAAADHLIATVLPLSSARGAE